jgi:large subunit ribosomal protein L9
MARTLSVVFKSDVRGIAQAGDVKKVSPGYARNYLFPRQLAFPATDAALKQWETVRLGTIAKVQRKREAAQVLAGKVEAVSCTITAKVGPEGRLFGSVGRQEIVAALAQQGLTVEKHALALNKPIKQVGVTTITVQLPSGVEAKLTVTVAAAN